MSRSAVAAVLSFLIPGAGLWYVGRSGRAIINFVVAAIITLCALYTAHEHVHYALLAVAAGSAGYAHAVGKTAGQDEAG